MHRLFALILIAASLVALDVKGDPPRYLTETFRADWKKRPLSEVLERLGAHIEKPVVRSDMIRGFEEKRLVTLIDERKVPLRETLEWLERLHDLHFTTEPLRLRAETATDARNRRRRAVNLSLRDYATDLPLREHPMRRFGYATDLLGCGGGPDLFC